MEKRKLLVISYYFAPKRAIASVRWSKLAKYITARGWDVDVLTTSSVDMFDALLAADIKSMGNVIFIDHADGRFAPTEEQRKALKDVLDGRYYAASAAASDASASEAASERRGLSALKYRIAGLAPVRYILSRRNISEDVERSRDFAGQAVKYIREQGGLDKYDAVVSSFGPVGDAMIAMRLKELYPDKPVIMDFRDPMDLKSYPRSVQRKMHRMQKRVCHTADAVCAVSEGTALKISECSDKKVSVITNGYDRADMIKAEPDPSERFTLCYTGDVYIGLDDLTPLWRCLRELADSGDIDLSKTSFVLAGRQTEFFRNDMAAFGIDGILDSRGRVDREEAMELQKSSDGLLVCVWNTKDSQGILSGKFFEYMLAGKPIVALVSGDLGGSEVRSIIEKGSMGVAYEQADSENGARALKEYILALYNQKINGVPLNYAPDADVVGSYAYENLALRYMELIDKVCG